MPGEITTEVLKAYFEYRSATGNYTEQNCRKHVRRVAKLLRVLHGSPEFAWCGFSAADHPFDDGRRKYGSGDADADIAPLLQEFDVHVGPWVLGEVSSTGLSLVSFIAQLDQADPPPMDGKEALLQKHWSKFRKISKEAEISEALESNGFLLPKKRWSERTLAQSRSVVQAAALALRADTGCVLTSMEEFTRPRMVHAATCVLKEANGHADGVASRYAEVVFHIAQKIAQGYVRRCPEDLEELARLRAKEDSGRSTMAPGNLEKLRRFTPERLDMFVDLSSIMLTDIEAEVSRRLRARPRADRKRPKVEVYDTELVQNVMCVLAHDMMLARAPRKANCVNARLDWVRWYGSRATIVVPAKEVKMREHGDDDLPIPLGEESSGLLKTYLTHIRSRALHPGDETNPFLFPGQGRGDLFTPNRPYGNLLGRLCGEVHERVGARLHPHLYRHMVGWIWLRDDPARLDDVRIILGHSSIETTRKFYIALDETLALDRWNDHVNQRQQRYRRRA